MMNEIEKLEYKLNLMTMYKEKFYDENLKYRAISKTGKTMAKIIDKKALTWAQSQADKAIEDNGYPDVNPFLEGLEQIFTLFYTPEIGLSEVPKAEKYIPAHDANEFYNAVKEGHELAWSCNTIDEAMFDILYEKYGVDHAGGFADQLREKLNMEKIIK